MIIVELEINKNSRMVKYDLFKFESYKDAEKKFNELITNYNNIKYKTTYKTDNFYISYDKYRCDSIKIKLMDFK